MCAKLLSTSNEWSLKLEKTLYTISSRQGKNILGRAAHFPAMLTQQEKWQQHVVSFVAKIHCGLMNKGMERILNEHYLVHSVVAISYSFLDSFSNKSLLYNDATSWFKVADISTMEQQDILHTISCIQLENTGYCDHQKDTSSFTNHS